MIVINGKYNFANVFVDTPLEDTTYNFKAEEK